MIVEKVNIIWGLFQKLVGSSFAFNELKSATPRERWNQMQSDNIGILTEEMNETSKLNRQVDFILGYWTCLLAFLVDTSDWTALYDYIIAKLQFVINYLTPFLLKPPRKWWF